MLQLILYSRVTYVVTLDLVSNLVLSFFRKKSTKIEGNYKKKQREMNAYEIQLLISNTNRRIFLVTQKTNLITLKQVHRKQK